MNNRIFISMIGEYQWLCWICFAILCIIIACFVLRNEEKIVVKPKKIRYSKLDYSPGCPTSKPQFLCGASNFARKNK